MGIPDYFGLLNSVLLTGIPDYFGQLNSGLLMGIPDYFELLNSGTYYYGLLSSIKVYGLIKLMLRTSEDSSGLMKWSNWD